LKLNTHHHHHVIVIASSIDFLFIASCSNYIGYTTHTQFAVRRLNLIQESELQYEPTNYVIAMHLNLISYL
jgi:hypothetical protein